MNKNNTNELDFDLPIQQRNRKLFLYADERKMVIDRWEYHCILIITEEALPAFLSSLLTDRDSVGYFNEMKFGSLHKKGVGEKVELANRWMNRLLDEAGKPNSGVYFTLAGIDRHKIDFSCFGSGDGSEGKYANLYNRFFRASIIGAIHLYFPNDNVTIKSVYHDQQGHLENHEYFEWHISKKIREEATDIDFECDEVKFVCSDHHKEEKEKSASHLIQFVDILIGALTYCIHITNKKNLGQRKVAETILPLLQEIIYRGPKKPMRFNVFRRFSASHFPVDRITKPELDLRRGSYYLPSCKDFESALSRQGDLFG